MHIMCSRFGTRFTATQLGMAVLAAILLGKSSASNAQDKFPLKPIRFVLSFGAPGGVPDVAARLIGAEMTKAWGQPVLVDPRTGAGGIIGAETVAKATPDGYTWLINSPAHVINPALHGSNSSYDPVADFVPVSLMGKVPNVMVIHPSIPARNLKEFIVYAKANQGKLNYGSTGVGSSQHMSGELFSKMTGVKMTHVPYKAGGTTVVPDIVAGRLQLLFGSATSLPHVRSGKLIALGVTTLQRNPAMPDLPTLSEAGLPGYEAASWYAMLGPAGTSKPIVQRISQEVSRIFKMPDVREKLIAVTMSPVASTPDEATAFIKEELAKWTQIVKEAGVKPET